MILVAQLGCGWGKSTLAAAMAIYWAFEDLQHKIFIATATPWLEWQLRLLFNMELDRQAYRPLAELIAEEDLGGVCCILHDQLASIPSKVLAKSLVIVDEGHVLLPEPKLALVPHFEKLLQAGFVLFLSATFGDAFGLKTIQGRIAKLTPYYRTLYVQPEGLGPEDRFAKVKLTHLEYCENKNLKAGKKAKLPKQMLPALVAAMVKKWTEQKLPTVIVAPTPELAALVHARLSKYLTDSNRAEAEVEFNWLRKPRLFTGAVDPAVTCVFEGIHKGAVDDTRVIVTSYNDAIGVNFWPRCLLVSTHIPWTLEVLGQTLGRSNRQDPNGMRDVAWPLTSEGDRTTAKGLKESLQNEIYQGKCRPLIGGWQLLFAFENLLSCLA